MERGQICRRSRSAEGVNAFEGAERDHRANADKSEEAATAQEEDRRASRLERARKAPRRPDNPKPQPATPPHLVGFFFVHSIAPGPLAPWAAARFESAALRNPHALTGRPRCLYACCCPEP